MWKCDIYLTHEVSSALVTSYTVKNTWIMGKSIINNENLLVFIEFDEKQYNVKCAVSVRDIIVIVHRVAQVWKVRLYASTEICRTHWKNLLGRCKLKSL